MDYVTAFMIGFLGSLHCIGMCGPIALALPLDRSNFTKQITGIGIYNSARLITYSLIGLLLGLFGKGLSLFGLQQYFSIGMGILIIVGALLPYSIERVFNLTPFLSKLLSKLKLKLGIHLKKHSSTSLFAIGFFNGFLPCGLVYFAVIGAIGSFDTLQGALFMVVFGIGTLPMMFAAALSPGFISITWRNRVKKILPFFAIMIGVLFILRGLNLGIPYVSPKLLPGANQAVECHE